MLACFSEDPPCFESSNPSQVTVREQEELFQSSAKSSPNWCFQPSEFRRFVPELSAPEGERALGCSSHPQQPHLGTPAQSSSAHQSPQSHRQLPVLGWPRGSRTWWEQGCGSRAGSRPPTMEMQRTGMKCTKPSLSVVFSRNFIFVLADRICQ